MRRHLTHPVTHSGSLADLFRSFLMTNSLASLLYTRELRLLSESTDGVITHSRVPLDALRVPLRSVGALGHVGIHGLPFNSILGREWDGEKGRS